MNLTKYIISDIKEIIKIILKSLVGFFGIYIRQIIYSKLFLSDNKNFFISNNVTINSFKNISIEQNTKIMQNCSIYANNGKVTIKKNTAMNQNVLISAEGGEINIGKDVLVGPNTVIRSSNHKFSNKEIPIIEQGHSHGKITIEDNVWIGANCVILKNTIIGSGSIVGAGSVVTKNVEKETIVGGVPAKLIKRR